MVMESVRDKVVRIHFNRGLKKFIAILVQSYFEIPFRFDELSFGVTKACVKNNFVRDGASFHAHISNSIGKFHRFLT